MENSRRKCPSCDSGWFHADELGGGFGGAEAGRLVPCPTCQGRGWVDDAMTGETLATLAV